MKGVKLTGFIARTPLFAHKQVVDIAGEEAISKRERIYAVVRQIPAGQVATYGDIAALAGLPGHARQVGYALFALPEFTDVPWHRVINAKGMISIGRARPGGEIMQQRLLEQEGVSFINGKTDLRRYRWQPETGPLKE